MPKRRSPKTSWKTRLLGVGLLLATTVLTWAATWSQPAVVVASARSPLIWGTNLSLYDQRDAFLTNPTVATLTQQAHVQLIRFPDRGNPALTEAAAKKIKALQKVPLLILPYGKEHLERSRRLVQMMSGIFGNQETVYYEYGNEKDLAQNGNVQKEAYTASWNEVIPHLRPLAPTGKFLGPSNYQWNPSYIGYFVKHAQPRPDAVSWHEYTCGTKDPDSTCLGSIANWSKHIKDTRAAMQSAIGSELPVMMTEYNWNANADADTKTGQSADPRARNETFLSTWTKAALSELMKNQVFAANHYVLTNNQQLAMISDTTQTLTAAGRAFQATFEQSGFPMPTPTSSLTPPASVTTTPMPSMTATPLPGSASQVCIQGQIQGGASTSSGTLCVSLIPSSGNKGEPVGTLCLPLTPASEQPAATALGGKTLCVPVYVGTDSAAPVTPTPVATRTPTNAPTSTSTPVVTRTPTPTATPPATSSPTAVATAQRTPMGTPFIPPTATTAAGS